MRNIEKRGTTTTLEIKDWHKIECNKPICLCYNCIEKTPGRKIKQKKQGRPPAKLAVWSRAKLNKIRDTIPKLSVAEKEKFDLYINSHLELCICPICKVIYKQPILLTKCLHSFCIINCIMPNIEGKQKTMQSVPRVNIKFHWIVWYHYFKLKK